MSSMRRQPGDAPKGLAGLLQRRRAAQDGPEPAGATLSQVAQQRFLSVLETIPAYVVLLTEDYQVAFANRFFRERFGESSDQPCYAYLFGRTEPCDNCETYKVLDTSEPHRWEWNGPDGRTYDVHDFPFVDADGKRLILEMGIDVTAERMAEQELRREQERLETVIRARTAEIEQSNVQLKAVLDNLTEGLVSADLEGRVFHWNPAAIAMHGFSNLAECQRRLPDFAEIFELSTPDGRVLPVDEWPLSRILRGETLDDLELHIRRLEGDWTRIFLYGGTLARDAAGQPLLAVVSVTDITERRQGELALRASEQRLRQANDTLEAVTVGAEVIVGVIDLDHRYLFFNRRYQEEVERLSGKSVQIGASMLETFAHMPEQLEILRREWEPALRGESTDRRVEFGDPQRYRRVYSVRHTPIRDANGRVAGAGEVAFEVTEQVHAEERLKYLASFPGWNPNPIVEADLEGYVCYANPAAERALPGLRETGPQHPWLAGWAETVRPFREGRSELLVRDVAVGERVYQQTLAPLREKGVVRIYGVDVTARKQAEDALRELNYELERRVDKRTAELHASQERYRSKCEQLEALSARLAVAQEEERRRIAQGLHDEVCQLLVACHLKLGALCRAATPERRAPLAEEIDRLLTEAGDELRGLAFELTSSTLYEVGFEEAVEELCDHMESTFGVRFEVEWDRRHRVLAENRRAPLYHAVRELMHNVVKHAEVDGAVVRIGGEAGRIRIELEDQGRGFDPAATAQAAGRSGGFGLLNVQERLREIGASLEIRSAPGGGTRAVIEAPSEELVP